MRDVLESIHGAIAEKKQRLQALQGELEALKKAAEILQHGVAGNSASFDVPNDSTGSRAVPDTQSREGSGAPEPKRWPVAVGDAAFLVLDRAGAPMHVKELRVRLAEMGVRASRATVDSCLRKDTRKRFHNYGRATWGLRAAGSAATS